MDNNNIQSRYKINPGTIKIINDFKNFVGSGKFEEICQGIAVVEIPLEEDKFEELMKICLSEEPESKYSSIPYSDAEEILSFFCKPFAGRSLKQVQSMLDGISSLLQKVDPKLLRTLMESSFSRTKNGTSTGA